MARLQSSENVAAASSPSCDTDTVFKNATACRANQPAGSHICREDRKEAEKGRVEERKERKGEEWSKAGLDGIICKFYGSNPKFELLQMRGEEEETNKTH